MMKRLIKTYKDRDGSILILALWAVTFLAVLAVNIGWRVRARIGLLARIEDASQLHFIAEAGIKKAVAVLREHQKLEEPTYAAYSKASLHNNPDAFQNKDLGQGSFDVQYPYYIGNSLQPTYRHGFVDEESKLNINLAHKETIFRLIRQVGIQDDDEAMFLAEAIIDWRELGQSQITGFYSDDFYSNLEYPIVPKDAEFELLDELLLLPGMTESLYERLLSFITIYGDGRININTAAKEVLLAVGLSPEVVDKILQVRRGFDGVEATIDDYVFQKAYDITSDIKNFIELTPQEVQAIDRLNFAGLLKTKSSCYTIRSSVRLRHRPRQISIICVYNLDHKRFEYWREK